MQGRSQNFVKDEAKYGEGLEACHSPPPPRKMSNQEARKRYIQHFSCEVYLYDVFRSRAYFQILGREIYYFMFQRRKTLTRTKRTDLCIAISRTWRSEKSGNFYFNSATPYIKNLFFTIIILWLKKKPSLYIVFHIRINPIRGKCFVFPLASYGPWNVLCPTLRPVILHLCNKNALVLGVCLKTRTSAATKRTFSSALRFGMATISIKSST